MSVASRLERVCVGLTSPYLLNDADALNVFVENCGNPYCEYMVESSQGNFFIAFGDKKIYHNM